MVNSAKAEHLPEDSTGYTSEAEVTKNNSLIHVLKSQEEFILNKEGIIISSNLEVVNVTGYEEYEILGKHISLLYPSDLKSSAETHLEQATKAGKLYTTGLRLKKRDVAFWAKMNIYSLDAETPNGPCFRVVLEDATHRALSRERVKALRDEYLAIFNNPFLGTYKFRIDDFRVTMCNQKTLDICGIQQVDDLGFDSLFRCSQQFELFVGLLKNEKQVEGFKFLVRDSRRTEDNWAVISARYFENRGFVEGIIFDISEQYSQMLELQRVNEQLDNFTYHASHDLRAPLSSILGLLNLGTKEASMETVQTYLEMIRGRVDHMDTLLKDLIAVSYNNTTEPKTETFNFKYEVADIIKASQYPDLNFDINVEIFEGYDFRTDAIRLRTVLRNLLSNAFKYHNPEVEKPKISLSIRVDPTHCAIQLRDNGIGIEHQFKNRVYEMFFRATDRSTGTGLGLYIVKSMLEKLKGKISFESTLNIGTTFLITIPNRAFDHQTIEAA
jgi:PAS domain S-box-containing protein